MGEELKMLTKPKKPKFRMQNSWRIKRLDSTKWRKPKGLHSKIRLKKAGNPKMPSPGYRAPKVLKFQDPSGVHTVLVRSISQLSSITNEAIIVASNLGNKKKVDLVKMATEKKIKIINLPDNFIASIEKQLAERKERRIKLKASITKVEKESKDKKKDDKKEKTPEDQEEKIMEGVKEQQKIVTRKK